MGFSELTQNTLCNNAILHECLIKASFQTNMSQISKPYNPHCLQHIGINVGRVCHSFVLAFCSVGCHCSGGVIPHLEVNTCIRSSVVVNLTRRVYVLVVRVNIR